MRKLFLLLTLIGICTLSAPIHAAVVGDGAPSFQLVDTNGDTHSLADFKGKFVILEWTNYDCPFVKKHYDSGNMQKLQKDMTQKGVVWLSIASSAAGKQGNYSASEWNQRSKQQGAAATAILLDEEGTVGRKYGAQTTPHMYIINPEGVLVYQGAIDSNPSADPEDIPESINYIKTGVFEAMSGNKLSFPSTKAYGCSVKYAN